MAVSVNKLCERVVESVMHTCNIHSEYGVLTTMVQGWIMTVLSTES